MRGTSEPKEFLWLHIIDSIKISVVIHFSALQLESLGSNGPVAVKHQDKSIKCKGLLKIKSPQKCIQYFEKVLLPPISLHFSSKEPEFLVNFSLK